MPTYYDYRKVVLTQDQAQDLTIGLIIGVFLTMGLNVTSPEVSFLVALAVLLLAEVLTFNEALTGFSNDGLITIGSLFLVIGAIEKAHIVDYGSRKAFGMNSSEFWGKLRMYWSSFFVSAFFNNIPQVAIMIPVVKDWARLRKIPSSQLLIPLSYTVLAGGMLATVGTSTNLVVQGLLSSSNLEQFNFFDPAVVGLPAGAILIAYMMVAGKYLLPHHEEKTSAEHDRNFTHVAELTIHEDSCYCNKAVRYIFEGLGMTSDNLVKIRRLASPLSAAMVMAEVNNSSIGRYPSHRILDHKTYTSIHESRSAENPVNIVKNHWNSSIDFVVSYIDLILPSWLQLSSGFEQVNEIYLPDSVNYEDIHPDQETVLQAGDILFVANAVVAIGKVMKTMPWENHGITFYGNIGNMELPAYKDLLVELVVSNKSEFVGRKVVDVAADISAKYECAILTAKSIDDSEDSIEKQFARCSTNSQVIQQGTSILVVTNKTSYGKMILNPEFVSVSTSAKLDKPATLWSFYPLVTFLTIVSLVAGNQIEMMPAAMSMAAFFFVGGWLVPDDIDKYIDVRLLMLMGASLSFALAMTKTGLALKIANELSSGIQNPQALLFVIYAATLFITEIISNNAAAALMYPIAVALAGNLGYNYKPFVMVVMQAASMAFMCPIGYPTHVMVWRPGNYGFMDFVKFGLVPNIIWMIVSCLICPAVWPI